MNLTIQIPIIDISRKINKVLPSPLYKGDVADYEDFTIVVQKRGDFRLKAENDTIFVEAPIRAELFIGPKALLSLFAGLVKKIEEIDVDITAIYEIKPDVNTKWQLVPKIKGRFLWDKNPVFSLAGLKLPLAQYLDWVIEGQIKSVGKMIEKYLREQLKIEEYVEMAWKIMHEPIEIDPNYALHLYFHPEASHIYATPIACQGGILRAVVSVPLFPEAAIGAPPVRQSIPKLPDFEPVAKLPANSDLSVSATVLYAFVSDFLKNKSFDFDGFLQKIHIYSVKVSEHNGNLQSEISLALSISLLGFAIKTPLLCEIVADLGVSTPLKNLSVQLLNIRIVSGNFLLKWAFYFYEKKIKSLITTTIERLYEKYFPQIKELIAKNLDARALGKYVFLNGKLKTFDLHETVINENEMALHIQANANVAITIGNF